jgi:hypothetical protein
MPSILVGWRIAARVHGLELLSGIRQRIEEGSEQRARHPVDVYLTADPLQPEFGVDLPKYLRAGKMKAMEVPIAAATEERHPLAPPTAWLTIDALDRLGVDPAPYQGIDLSGPDAGQREHDAAMAMLATLERRIEAAVKPRAELAFGLLAVLLPHGVCEQRISVPLIASPRGRAIFRNRLFLSEFVGSGAPTAQELAGRIRAAVPAIYSPEETAKVLRVATSWYVKARLEDSVSNGRFVFGFLALESLCSLAPRGMEPADAQNFETLEGIAQKHSSELLAYVKALKGRCAGPSLGQRFARLARDYDPDDGEADAETFAKCARLRNDLVHCRITEIPIRMDGSGPHPSHSVMQLAAKYLRLVIGRIEERGRSRVVSTPTEPPPSESAATE